MAREGELVGRPSGRAPVHGWSRDRFCDYLKAQRNRASLSIEDIARTTKIPERSLRQLEAGQFEDLPADVFVRGFLRSYARCVGVDGDEVVRRYALCGLSPAPVASDAARDAAERLAELTAHELSSQRDVGPARLGEASVPARESSQVDGGAATFADTGATDTAGATVAAQPDERGEPTDASEHQPPPEASGGDLATVATAPSADAAPASDAAAVREESASQKAATEGGHSSKSHRRGGKRRKRGRSAAPSSKRHAAAPVAGATDASVSSEPKTALTVLRAGPASIDGRDEVATDDGRARGLARLVKRPLHSDPDDDVGEDHAALGEDFDSSDVEPLTITSMASRTRREPTKQRAFLPPSWADDDASRRGPLTLAVIILVIVATLTMSYLLRRPSYTGDGMTEAPPSAASSTARV